MSEVGEVHANLVRSSGSELRLDERERAEALERAENGASRPAPASGRERRAAGAGPWPADCAVHETLSGQLAANEGNVPAVDAVSAELPLQALRGVVRQRQDENARSFAIEAVDDEDTPVMPGATLDFRAGPADNGVLVAFGRRVHEQTRGLVDHQDLGVGVDDLNRRDLGSAGAFRQGGIVRHGVGRGDERSRVGDDDAVHEHVSDDDLLLGPGVRDSEYRLSHPGEPERRRVHDRSVALRGRSGWTAPSLPG